MQLTPPPHPRLRAELLDRRLAAVEVRARELLIRRAAGAGAGDPFRAVLTYAEFCGDIDPGQRYWRPPRFGGIARVLCRIGTYEHAGGRPLLTALVVRAGNRRAGPGFAGLARNLGFEIGPDQEASFWQAQVTEAVQYWAGAGLDQRPGDDARQGSAAVAGLAGGVGLGRGDGRGGYWWQGLSGENVFMEITRRDDIGKDLNAPSAARGGAATASYALVPLVGPGDVVIHYDSRREAIAGVSVAASGPEPAAVYWAARGSYARRAGERLRWLPGVRVPLAGYRPLEPPLTLTAIRARSDELLALRNRLETAASGQPVYFPWIRYQDTIRTFQSYLVKMPREAISLFPDLDAAVGQAGTDPAGLSAVTPVQQAEAEVSRSAGQTARAAGGQGFQLDQAAKVAIEVHAMNAATAYYATSWTVDDVHGSESFDLLCRRGGEILHVEVKGTTTAGTDVILTPNEVRHARDHSYCALFILSGITLERSADGSVTASGGVRTVHDPWRIDDGTLLPIGYRYQPPQGGSG